jgi:hypothetical protein
VMALLLAELRGGTRASHASDRKGYVCVWISLLLVLKPPGVSYGTLS